MSSRKRNQSSTIAASIFQDVTLPCGLMAQNRLVKVAMYEHLAGFRGGFPNTYHFDLYSEWAKHGWGIIVTGNVQVAKDHLTLGRDLILPESIDAEEQAEPFRKLAAAIHGEYPSAWHSSSPERSQTLAIMQLSHAGRQSGNLIGGRPPFVPPEAPSAVPLTHGAPGAASDLLNFLLFQTPRAMTEKAILSVVDRFVDGGVLAFRTGFDGIQLHAAHGYLLAQFLSEKTNKRQDAYALDNALSIIRLIVERIRMATSKSFAICVKISAADYISEEAVNTTFSRTETSALGHLLEMASWGLLDIIEISGGDYENPEFMTSTSKSSRQAFFAKFSHQALKSLDSLRGSTQHPLPLVLLTGGLRTPDLICSALASNDADLLGIGRGSVLCPDLPSVLRERLRDMQRWGSVPFRCEPVLRSPSILEMPPLLWVWRLVPQVRLIGAGMNMAWYIVAMRQIAYGANSGNTWSVNVGGFQAVFWMWAWYPRTKSLPTVSNSRTLKSSSGTRRHEVISLLIVVTLFAYLWNAYRKSQ